MQDIEATPAGLYPVRAVMLRRHGRYIAETVLLDRHDKDGWQRITRDRDSEYLGRLRMESVGSLACFLERPTGTSTRHPDLNAAIAALGKSLDDAEA